MLKLRNLRRRLFNAAILNTEVSLADIKKPRDEIEIVVVGAGLAGLSAASHLLKNGFKRTLVLEATERYGGRINSKQFGDAFCELGAKWITIDSSKDSIYEILKLASGLQKKLQQDNDAIYVNTSGEKINKKLPELIDLLFKRLCSGLMLQEKFKVDNLHDLNSVHTYFQAETGKIIKSMFNEEDQILAKEIFASLFKEFGSLLGCCLEYLNIEHITKMQTRNPSPLYIPTGLDNILQHITKNIDADHMQVGKPVGEIKWHVASGEERKSVGCVDGSLFTADHIICTLPLGVLKTFSGYMFKPILPKEKIRAIKNLGFGSPVKIYFEYDDDIKPWFIVNIRPLWNTQVRRKDIKWIKQIVEISRLPVSNRVLEILIGGSFYHDIEKLPDMELLHEVTKILRTCLKNPKIPYPSSVLRSNWNSSACFLGGRPYFSTGSTTQDVTNLAAPLGKSPSLLFAGDATILTGFGTLDGARKSGIREAERIIEYYERS